MRELLYLEVSTKKRFRGYKKLDRVVLFADQWSKGLLF